ncbi:GPCR kinase [Trema orientale]|uniref:GPCR kinase n=1 Tax=Trema orientale TaxID=63057 RepID=A0A2P5FDK3_TREOI|nr:GPCR kinase [Trema orientale]
MTESHYYSSSYIKVHISSQKNSNTTAIDSHKPFALPLMASFAVLLAVLMIAIVVTLLGQGGFGKVFKGVLKDGTIVAIKRPENTRGTKHKIAHLDVKPHNILLDDNFCAKLSDFGMSKLINRDESQVVTGVRGTVGYLAPEWEHSRISVKVNVYSFRILLLEIITGRKILDFLQPHSDIHLLTLLEKKAFENRLKDMVECQSEDMQN